MEAVKVGDDLLRAHTVSCHVEDEYEKVKKYVIEELSIGRPSYTTSTFCNV